RGVHEVRVALGPHGGGAVVVGGRGVERGDLVGGADGQRAATGAVTSAAAVGVGGLRAGGEEDRHTCEGDQSGAPGGGVRTASNMASLRGWGRRRGSRRRERRRACRTAHPGCPA